MGGKRAVFGKPRPKNGSPSYQQVLRLQTPRDLVAKPRTKDNERKKKEIKDPGLN